VGASQPEFRFWFVVRAPNEYPVVALEAAGAGWVGNARWPLASEADRQAFIAAAIAAVIAAGPVTAI